MDKEGVVKEVKSIEQVQFNDRTLSAREIDGQLRVPSDTKVYWDIGSRLGNSYFTDDFVLEFEVDYTSSQALEQALTTALKEAGFSGGWSANGDVFGNGQTSYEAAVNEGRLTIYNGVDSNGSGIALPSSDIPPFSKLMEITDAWAQTIILANNNITIPAGSTSGGIELVASIAENAEIPEFINIKLKNAGEYGGQFYMNTTEISTQGQLDNLLINSPTMHTLQGSFVDDRIISWDLGAGLGNSYFTDDFVLEFEVDYTSSQALEQALTTALKEAGFSGGWSANGDVFGNGQTSYEAAVNEGRLTIYNGVDSNGSGIALPSSDIPPFSKLMEITDAWAQTIILANNNITIPAGSTSGGIELVASIAENAEIPEFINIKLKNAGEYGGQFYMNTTEISTQGQLDNLLINGPTMHTLQGSFVDDRIISWDLSAGLGNSYFTDDFVLEFEVDYTSSQALEQALTTALKEAGFNGWVVC